VGQFKTRPREVLGQINEPFAAAIVYPAVMAAWTYLAAGDISRLVSAILAVVVFAIGCTVTLWYNYVLRRRTEAAEAAASRAEGSLG
jgi:hypothetical protein